MLSDEILTMPKIDLHCHMDGSMTLESMREILGKTVPAEAVQADVDCVSLSEYLEKFNIPLECIQTEEGLRKSAKDFLISLTTDHIKYVEVRFAPVISKNQQLNCTRVMEAVLEGLEEARKECGIFYQVIACAMRHYDEETNLRMLKECREFLGEGLCAVDLAGDESGFPTSGFQRVFDYAKKLDYPFTIHSGECGSVRNILDAVEMGAGRIGHGIAMTGQPRVQKVLAERRIAVEMCPLSNYQTKAVKLGQIYPIREFAQNGVLVTLNTDNRTVSNTSIAKEMEFLHEKFGITEEELRQYQRNAIDAAFCDDAVKNELWKALR